MVEEVAEPQEGGHSIVSVGFVRATELNPEIIKDNNLKNENYVEVRVENSAPTIKMENIKSPARKVRDLLLAQKK
jgi:hypothetical protein